MSQAWSSIGPEGGFFKSFAFDRLGRTYAGSDDSGGVWGSDDGGTSWRLLTGDFPDLTGWDIVVTESAPGVVETVHVVDLYGRYPLLRSTDRGETWELRGTALPDTGARRTSCLVVDPADHDHLWVGTGFENMHQGDGLWESRDGGRSWEQLGFAGYDVPKLVYVDGVLFAAVHAEGRHAPYGLGRSRDGGRTWEVVPPFDGIGVGSLKHSEEGGLLVAAGHPQSSVWRSRDLGETWTPLGLAGIPVWDAVATGPTGVVAGGIVGGPGVYATEDDGATWTSPTGLESAAIIALRRNPFDGSLFAGNFGNMGIQRSTDGARSFHYVNAGLHAVFATSVATSPVPGQLLTTLLGSYEVVPDANVVAAMHSADGGRTWRRCEGVAAHGLCAAIDPANPSRALLGTFRQGIWHSADGGASFARSTDAEIATAVAFTPQNACVAAVLDLTDAGLSTRFVRAEQPAGPWETVAEGRTAKQLVRAGDLLYAAGTGVQRSDDDGRTWTTLLSRDVQCVAVDSDDSSRLIAGLGVNTVLLSDDAGVTWREVDLPAMPVRTRGVYHVRRRGDLVVAALSGAEESVDVHGGFFVSTDGAASWRQVQGGLYNDQVWGLAEEPDGSLVAATYAGGLFRLDASELKV